MSAPAPGELVVRALPTAFDPADGPVTVATPSCCCCCCCCLATTAGAIAFTATDAHYRGKESGVSGGRRVLAMLLGLAAMPIAIAVVVTAAQWGDPGAAILLSMLAYVVVAVGAFKIAGAPTAPSIGVAVLAATAIAMLFAIELVLALATAFIIELTVPLTIWLGIVISRSRFPTGDGGPEWPPPEQRHVFRPWEDPMSPPPPPPPPPESTP